MGCEGPYELVRFIRHSEEITGWTSEIMGLDFRKCRDISLSSLRPEQTQPPIEWVPDISPGVKRSGIKADKLHFTGEFKNACNHIFTPPYVDDRVLN